MMISPILRRHLIPISRAFLVALSLLSTASHGQAEIKGTPLPASSAKQIGINPTLVEQTLVPESVLVMQLIEALNLEPVADSAKAEDLLSSLGIEPVNGWIAEYPVTPQILGDVEQGIAMAADQGKIAFNKEQALKQFRDVKLRLGFDIKPDSKPSAGLIKKPGKTTVYIFTDTNGVTHFTDDHDSIPREYLKSTKSISRSTPPQGVSSVANTPAETSAPRYNEPLPPEEIDDHYDEQGPPVVTYYAPPDTYTYLYSWVPYPFWSTGRYFPGYYVMNNFNRRVLYNRQHYDVKHHARNAQAFSHSRHGSRVNRIWQGQSNPRKKDYAPGFTRPNAKSDARANVKANQYPNGLRQGADASRRKLSRKWNLSYGNSRTLGNNTTAPNDRMMRQKDRFRSIQHSGERNLHQPSFNQRSYVPNTPRFNPPPAFSQDRALRPSRPADGNFHRGYQGGGSFGGFQGSGNFMNQGGRGGASSGTSRGGRR